MIKHLFSKIEIMLQWLQKSFKEKIDFFAVVIKDLPDMVIWFVKLFVKLLIISLIGLWIFTYPYSFFGVFLIFMGLMIFFDKQ